MPLGKHELEARLDWLIAGRGSTTVLHIAGSTPSRATRAAMRRNRMLAGDRILEVRRWTRMELALVLAEATGRPLGSIRALRWDDIDWDRGTLRWRAEADKKGLEWVVPSPAALLDELREFYRALGVPGGLLFPSEKNPLAAMDRHLFDKWLTVAERGANLPKLTGCLWQSYRRKWASERRHHPLPDVAAAGLARPQYAAGMLSGAGRDGDPCRHE